MLELQAIEDALERSYGQKKVAAKMLGINADQLRYKVVKFFTVYPGIVRKYHTICNYYKLK